MVAVDAGGEFGFEEFLFDGAGFDISPWYRV